MISDSFIPPENNTKKRSNSLTNLQFKKFLSKDISKCPFFQTNTSVTMDDEPTQRQIDLVRISWQKVTETRLDTDDNHVSPAHAFGLAFYDALFELNIECKHLFTNVFQQARALTGMISYIARAPKVIAPNSTTTISDINAGGEYKEGDPEWLVIQLRELGAKHYFYKVQPHHFDLVGPAFVTALKKRLGNEYTDEIGEAWVKANAYAAYNMKIGYETQRAWEEGSINDRSSRKIKTSCTIQ